VIQAQRASTPILGAPNGTDTWRRAGWQTLAVRGALAVALVAMIWPAIAHAIEVWSTDEEFTYGFLILPIAAGIVWFRRDALRRSLGQGRTAGLAIVAASVVVLLISRRTGINNLGGIAVSPLLFGVAVYLWGWPAGRVLAFPCGFLLFGLGLYRGLLNSVGFALQSVTAVGAATISRGMGLDVVRDGLILHSTTASPSYEFVVAQTCSGMSSLLSLLSLAALWIYATRGSVPGRAAVIAGVLPLVIIANTTRVALVLVIASRFGEDAALGFFHGLSSLVLFGLALAGLLAVSRLVGCKLPTFATSS